MNPKKKQAKISAKSAKNDVLIRRVMQLTLLEIIILRCLNKRSGSTMHCLEGIISIRPEEIEKSFDTLQKKRLIDFALKKSMGGDFDGDAIDNKLFFLTAAGKEMLAKANHYLWVSS